MYETAAQRYDNYNELLAFYLRRSDREPALKARFDALRSRVFPQGLERVQLKDFTAEPAGGVTLLKVGDSGRRAGLRDHDIAVALDGYRVRNYKQYRVVRGAKSAPVMTFVVWRSGKYIEVRAPLRDSWPVSDLRDYVRGRAFVPTR
jgi:S1-C subfamily serine protease